MLFGGVIGLLIVDPATGAMWKLEEAVSIPLTRSDLPVPGEGGLTVLSLDQLIQRYHPSLVRVR